MRFEEESPVQDTQQESQSKGLFTKRCKYCQFSFIVDPLTFETGSLLENRKCPTPSKPSQTVLNIIQTGR